MAVWFLSNQEVFRTVGNMFGFGNKGSVHHAIMEVLEAINTLKDKYIQWLTEEKCME